MKSTSRPRITVIDGQGGKMGASLIAELAARSLEADVYAVGTNSAATAAMAKGTSGVATGESAVKYAARKSDVIVGPIGIVIADSLLGEISPEMAAAVGSSDAVKVLLPVSRCENIVVGCKALSLGELIAEAADRVAEIIKKK